MKKIPFNENYFDLDNEKSFYWAGLLAADGSLIDRVCTFKNGSKSHIKEVNLWSIEKVLIEGLYRDLGCVGRKIGEHHYQTLRGPSCVYGLSLKSHIMFDSLSRFGLFPRKSQTLQMPAWLEQHPLVSHFVRGYFDGGASVYFQTVKNVANKYIEFRGTTDFLESINRVIKTNIDQQTRAEVHIHSGTGSLKYSGNILVMKVADFMYKDSTIFLERKYNKLYT